MNNQDIIYQAKLHWIIFFGPALLFAGSFMLGSIVPQLNAFSLILIVMSLVWAFIAWMNYHFSALIITKGQVSLKSGFFVRQIVNIPISKIETIDIRQSIIGSILRYGTIIITGTGGTRQFINQIANPLTCRRHIEVLLHSV